MVWMFLRKKELVSQRSNYLKKDTSKYIYTMEQFMKDNIYFTSVYGTPYKKMMNTYNKSQMGRHEDFKNELRCKVAELKGLTKKIKSLPKGVQVKIYIYVMKNYLRHTFLPDTAKVPSHYDHMKYVTNEMGRVFIDNVHFLHMEFNTLPVNKYKILGCQCDFCLKECIRDDEKIIKYRDDPGYFLHNVKCPSFLDNTEELNHWNHLYIYDSYGGENVTYRRIFDPLYNHRDRTSSKRILTSSLIMDQIHFSKETRDKYMNPPPLQPMKFSIPPTNKNNKTNKRKRKRKRFTSRLS